MKNLSVSLNVLGQRIETGTYRIASRSAEHSSVKFRCSFSAHVRKALLLPITERGNYRRVRTIGNAVPTAVLPTPAPRASFGTPSPHRYREIRTKHLYPCLLFTCYC